MSFSHLIFTGPRRVGKTWRIIEATKALDGVMVCTTRDQAREIAAEHGIRTIVWNEDPQRLRGTKMGPLMFDTDAVARLIGELENQNAHAYAAVAERDREIEQLGQKLSAIGCILNGTLSYEYQD